MIEMQNDVIGLDNGCSTLSFTTALARHDVGIYFFALLFFIYGIIDGWLMCER